MEFIKNSGPYTETTKFPSTLPFAETQDLLRDCKSSEVLLGVDGAGEPVTADLDGDSPHILVSAPTGRGKSCVARSVAVQRLVRGDQVIVLDIKQHSHRWAKDLEPNVWYARTAGEIGNTLVQLGIEVQRRNEIVKDFDGPLDEAPVGHRLIVIFEEMNATSEALREITPKGEKCAALKALGDIAFMGRAVKIHLVSFAQLASRKASGGQEVIENYGTKILIGHSPTAWRWIASDCGRYRVAPRERGRGIVCMGGEASETQLVWLPEEDAETTVLNSVYAQRTARALSGGRADLPEVWRTAIGR